MMKRLKKLLCLTLAILMSGTLLTGCGKGEDVFQVIFAAPYVNEALVEPYGENLSLKTETPIRCSGFTFGSADVNAVTYGASAMMMSAMAAAGEVDVLVCDLEEAARYARSGMFADLTELFTAEELADFPDRLVTYDLVDENVQPTGEKTAPCGLDLSGRRDLTCILGSESYGIFILCNTGDPETAKEIFWEIVNS